MLHAALALQLCGLSPPGGALVAEAEGGYAFDLAATPRAVVLTWLQRRPSARAPNQLDVRGLALSLDARTLAPQGAPREVDSADGAAGTTLHGLAPFAEEDGTVSVGSCTFRAPGAVLHCALTALLGPHQRSPSWTLHPGPRAPRGERLAAAWAGTSGMLLLPREDNVYALTSQGSRGELVGNAPASPAAPQRLLDAPVLLPTEPDRALALWRRDNSVYARVLGVDALPRGEPVLLSPAQHQVEAAAAVWEQDHAARVVFAARRRERDPWQLQWVHWSPGMTVHTSALATGAAPARSPSLARTQDPRCQLLSWTEGRPRATSVRAGRVCNGALQSPSVLTVSAPGAEAGDSELASDGSSTVLAWQQTRPGGSAELRVARLACP